MKKPRFSRVPHVLDRSIGIGVTELVCLGIVDLTAYDDEAIKLIRVSLTPNSARRLANQILKMADYVEGNQ